jgi:hypothetical protein
VGLGDGHGGLGFGRDASESQGEKEVERRGGLGFSVAASGLL